MREIEENTLFNFKNVRLDLENEFKSIKDDEIVYFADANFEKTCEERKLTFIGKNMKEFYSSSMKNSSKKDSVPHILWIIIPQVEYIGFNKTHILAINNNRESCKSKTSFTLLKCPLLKTSFSIKRFNKIVDCKIV